MIKDNLYTITEFVLKEDGIVRYVTVNQEGETLKKDIKYNKNNVTYSEMKNDSVDCIATIVISKEIMHDIMNKLEYAINLENKIVEHYNKNDLSCVVLYNTDNDKLNIIIELIGENSFEPVEFNFDFKGQRKELTEVELKSVLALQF